MLYAKLLLLVGLVSLFFVAPPQPGPTFPTGPVYGDTDLPTGVVRERLSPVPRYEVDGDPVTRQEVIDAIGRVPDDTRKTWVVIVGREADTQRVLDDFGKPELARFRDSIIVRAYTPDHPVVRDRGYVGTGSPSITVVQPDGRVIARNRDGQYYGAAWLSSAIEQKPYTPDTDPDIHRPRLPQSVAEVPWWAWAVGGAALAFFLLNYRKRD
jgi:hypothetical protein